MKHLYRLFAMMIVASVVLAACGTAPVATQAPSVTEPSAAPVATEPAATAAPTTEKIELVYWSMWNEKENQAMAIQEAIKAFESANPNITIKVTWNGRQNQTLLRNAIASGTKVDFMDQDADQVAGGMVAAGQGYPLNDLITPDFEDIFVPSVLHMFDVDGKTYLVPYVYNTAQFFYSKDAFDKAGVTPPQTWDELLAACDKLNAVNINPIAVESDIQGYNAVYFTYLLARLKGPGWMRQAAYDKTGEMWKDPAVLQAAQMSMDLWTKGCIPDVSKGYKWPQAQETVAAGETAMELVGSWLPTELVKATGPDFKWGSFNFPEVSGGAGKSTDLMAFMLSYMILKDAPHPKESFEFIKFMLSEENQKGMVTAGLVGVPRKGVAWPANIADSQTAAETATVVFGEGDGLQGADAELWVKVIRDPFNDMFVGKLTPEQFVEKLVADTATYWKGK
ncbi:MAG: extracellular solute-binding protein [Chloroflexi bacterium]|nr:extracellular solute-binding protein [Chloroflexota bacterium]